MLWLIFRHLISQSAFLPSQKKSIRQPDLHGRAAEKLIQLTPICCIEAKLMASNQIATSAGSSSSLPTFLVGLSRAMPEDGIPVETGVEVHPNHVDYNSYLVDARKAVRDRYEATQCWQYEYDGLNPASHGVIEGSLKYCSNNNNDAENHNCDTTNDVTADGNDVTGTSFGSSRDFSGPVSLTEEEDREFWSLMRADDHNLRLSAAIKRARQVDDLSLSSTGNLSWSSSHDEVSPRDGDVDNTVCSLGPFLDVLFEKVELMPTNKLSTNLLVTSILSQLASYPQPLLRAVLIHPDIVLQPSVRGLITAVASLRQKLDNIMPTLTGSEDAIVAARKYLTDRLCAQSKRRDSSVSLVSVTISHLGNEARATRNSLKATFSSMFRGRKSLPENSPSPATNGQKFGQESAPNFSSKTRKVSLDREVRGYAMAAVLLEEWLQELAAIAHEQSALMKENSFNAVASKKKPSAIFSNPVQNDSLKS